MKRIQKFGKKILAFTLIMSLSIVLSACGSSSESSSSNDKTGASAQVKKPKEVSIGILNGLSSTSLIIASKKGFLKEEFEKEGIKVNEIVISSGGGPAIVNAMESNSINLGGMADQPAIQAAANGGTEKIIGIFSQSDKYVQLVVLKDKPYKSIKDLKGKKITVGVGTVGHRVLFQMLQDAGMKPDDVQIVNTPEGDLLTTLSTNFADAAVTTEPTASKLHVQGDINIIGTTEGTKTNYTVLVATGEFLKQYPDQVKAFLRAVKRAIDYLNDPKNHADAVKVLSEAAQVKPEVVEESLSKFKFDAGISNEAIASIQQSADKMFEMKIIRKAVKTSDFIDTSFVEALGFQKK